ncbi:MAG: ilvR [Hyphomicrobiales bacterium]|nr:ilvR [Hyphomicrobiales bacterium]
MEIRQIRYALTVARERSFTRASQRLNISQSAISEQVKSLEAQIGFELFRRTGRGVETTELGRTFLGEAERVASDVLGLEDMARRLKGLGRDSFRLGIGSGLAPLFLPRMFAAGVLPADLHVEVTTAPTRVIFDQLQAERLDLGIMIEVPPDRVPSGLAVTRMEEIEMVALATKALKLPVVKNRFDLARAGSLTFIMSEMSVGYGEAVADMFASLALRPRFLAAVDNVDTMKSVVRATQGVAIVPASAVDLARDGVDLQILPLFPARHVRAAGYTHRQALSRRKQAVIERLYAALSPDPA